MNLPALECLQWSVAAGTDFNSSAFISKALNSITLNLNSGYIEGFNKGIAAYDRSTAANGLH
jgi:hypothetical protein